MLERKCEFCKEQIPLDKENSIGAIFYDKKYYHENCFIEQCHKKLQSKVKNKLSWQKALNDILKLKKKTQKKVQELVEKDDLYLFILENYHISKINNRQWENLDKIYKGTYPGLLYKIGPVELLEEWRYYMPQLIENRQWKNIIGEQAFAYDMAIILSKNAEYRELMAKQKIKEQIKEAEKNVVPDVDYNAMTLIQQNTQKQRRNNRRSELFKEVMGNGD